MDAGREDRFTVADITGLVDFTRLARIVLPPEFVHLSRWRNELTARPSANRVTAGKSVESRRATAAASAVRCRVQAQTRTPARHQQRRA